MTVDTLPAVRVEPLAGRIGAVLHGVRLAPDSDAATVAAVRRAVLEHKVVFLRDQDHLTDETHRQLPNLFGEPASHPSAANAIDAAGHLLDLDSAKGIRANTWHTDLTFTIKPYAFGILRSVVIPERGGDTVWANTVAAYETLEPELRDLFEKLRVVHTNDYDYQPTLSTDQNDAEIRQYEYIRAIPFEVEHPAVTVHPETGERSLLGGGFGKRIVGYSKTASDALLALLNAHISRQEHTVRWQWRVGDVAIWDNRATQHYAINDYGTQDRVVRRAVVAGGVPVGVDGRPSVLLRGPEWDGTKVVQAA